MTPIGTPEPAAASVRDPRTYLFYVTWRGRSAGLESVTPVTNVEEGFLRIIDMLREVDPSLLERHGFRLSEKPSRAQ